MALLVDRQPASLDPLPAPYRDLFARLLEAVLPDERVRAVWLGGSLARGDADGASDLDVLLAVRDEDLEDFAAGWRTWLEAVTPTLLAVELPFARGSFTATTPQHCRLDVVLESVGTVPVSPHRRRVPVLDRDGLDAMVTVPQDPRGPDPDRLLALCTEVLRIEEITPFVLLERRDLLSVVAGIGVMHGLLVEILAETNQPLPPMGVKRIAARLTPEQQAILLGLAPAVPDREGLLAAVTAVGAAFRGPVRAAVEDAGAAWPTAVDDVVGPFVARSLAAGRVIL